MDWKILSAIDANHLDVSDKAQWKVEYLARMISNCDLNKDFFTDNVDPNLLKTFVICQQLLQHYVNECSANTNKCADESIKCRKLAVLQTENRRLRKLLTLHTNSRQLLQQFEAQDGTADLLQRSNHKQSEQPEQHEQQQQYQQYQQYQQLIQWECDQCGKIFRSESALKSHEMLRHLEQERETVTGSDGPLMQKIQEYGNSIVADSAPLKQLNEQVQRLNEQLIQTTGRLEDERQARQHLQSIIEREVCDKLSSLQQTWLRDDWTEVKQQTGSEGHHRWNERPQVDGEDEVGGVESGDSTNGPEVQSDPHTDANEARNARNDNKERRQIDTMAIATEDSQQADPAQTNNAVDALPDTSRRQARWSQVNKQTEPLVPQAVTLAKQRPVANERDESNEPNEPNEPNPSYESNQSKEPNGQTKHNVPNGPNVPNMPIQNHHSGAKGMPTQGDNVDSTSGANSRSNHTSGQDEDNKRMQQIVLKQSEMVERLSQDVHLLVATLNSNLGAESHTGINKRTGHTNTGEIKSSKAGLFERLMHLETEAQMRKEEKKRKAEQEAKRKLEAKEAKRKEKEARKMLQKLKSMPLNSSSLEQLAMELERKAQHPPSAQHMQTQHDQQTEVANGNGGQSHELNDKSIDSFNLRSLSLHQFSSKTIQDTGSGGDEPKEGGPHSPDQSDIRTEQQQQSISASMANLSGKGRWTSVFKNWSPKIRRSKSAMNLIGRQTHAEQIDTNQAEVQVQSEGRTDRKANGEQMSINRSVDTIEIDQSSGNAEAHAAMQPQPEVSIVPKLEQDQQSTAGKQETNKSGISGTNAWTKTNSITNSISKSINNSINSYHNANKPMANGIRTSFESIVNAKSIPLPKNSDSIVKPAEYEPPGDAHALGQMPDAVGLQSMTSGRKDSMWIGPPEAEVASVGAYPADEYVRMQKSRIKKPPRKTKPISVQGGEGGEGSKGSKSINGSNGSVAISTDRLAENGERPEVSDTTQTDPDRPVVLKGVLKKNAVSMDADTAHVARTNDPLHSASATKKAKRISFNEQTMEFDIEDPSGSEASDSEHIHLPDPMYASGTKPPADLTQTSHRPYGE